MDKFVKRLKRPSPDDGDQQQQQVKKSKPQSNDGNKSLNLKQNEDNCFFTKPNQPQILPQELPSQIFKNKTLTFRKSWFKDFTWLHIDNNTPGVLCFFCHMYSKENRNKTLVKKMEESFTTKGFINWKKALEKFRGHEKCDAHLQAVLGYEQMKNPIDCQMSKMLANDQEKARQCLYKIISSARLLARQGLAFRGHHHEEGNFKELLKVRSEDVPLLKKWLVKERETLTHESIQNEILKIMSKKIVQKICQKILSQKVPMFALICDGTRDISGTEQESVCVPWVNEDLMPEESFLGFYSTNETTGEAIASLLVDAMIRFQLPISQLRGQTYDGAANMSGCIKGVQTILKDKQPLAKFVHCGAHCLNLIIKDACEASTTTRNALQWAHEIGVLFSQSLNAKAKFISLIELESESPVRNIAKLKPLCPTRWVYRRAQIEELLEKYELVLMTLEQLSDEKDNSVSAKASGLLQSGTTILGLLLAKEIILQIEILNKIFQTRQITLSSVLAMIEDVASHFTELRTETVFEEILKKAKVLIAQFNLEDISLPRTRKPPTRYSGQAEVYKPDTIQQYYRKEYYSIIDAGVSGFNCRFDKDDLKFVHTLENVILTCNLSSAAADIISTYPELDASLLEAELKLFKNKKYAVSSVTDTASVLRHMTADIREIFNNIEVLVRILTVLPSSSCEAERSFSALRRLKHFLRNTMTQKRLNYLALCHVHQDLLDKLECEEIAVELINANERRKKIFGQTSKLTQFS